MRIEKSILAAAVIAGLAVPAAAEPIDLKFAYFGPERAITYNEVFVPFMEAVNADSQDTLNIEGFPGGTLGRSPAQQLKLVQDGVTDIAYIIPGYTAGVFPDDDLFELPLLLKDVREASTAMWRMYDMGLLRGYDQVKVLGLFASSAQMHMSFPADDISAIEGKKIRANGFVQTETVKALGGVPVGLVATQITESLDRGLLDGVLLDWNTLGIYQAQDVTSYHIDEPMGAITVMVAMNLDKWNSLPDEAKAAFDKHTGEPFADRYSDVLMPNIERIRDEISASPDHTVRTLTEAELADWEARFEPIYSTWMKQNPRGQERYDALMGILSDIRGE